MFCSAQGLGPAQRPVNLTGLFYQIDPFVLFEHAVNGWAAQRGRFCKLTSACVDISTPSACFLVFPWCGLGAWSVPCATRGAQFDCFVRSAPFGELSTLRLL